MHRAVAVITLVVLTFAFVLVESASSTRDDSATASESKNHWSEHPFYAPRVDDKVRAKAEKGGVGDATTAALDWLVRHQSEDGRWAADEHTKCCAEGKCKIAPEHGDDRPGMSVFDTGVTALALLAFVGRGNTHLEAENSEYQTAVERAARWLISQQQAEEKRPDRDGRIGPESPRKEYGPERRKGDRRPRRTRLVSAEAHAYNHAIATIALGELLVGSGDRELLGNAVQKAVDYTLRYQNKPFGWKYEFLDGRNDTSVSCWMGMAVATGRACVELGSIELEKERFSESWDGLVNWLDRATSGQSGRTGYEAPGDEGSRIASKYPGKYPYTKAKTRSNPAAALLILELDGISTWKLKRTESVYPKKKRKDGKLGKPRKVKKTYRVKTKDLAEAIAELPPEWTPPGDPAELSTINFYYWYYGALAIHQSGGKHWKTFSKALHRTLIDNQRNSGCEKGSWDPLGEWGILGGRVYTTAMGALALETEYRFRRGKLAWR